jgi:hypothetical protein
MTKMHSMTRGTAALACALALATTAARVTPPDPSAACVRALAQDPELQPLAPKTPLAFPVPRQGALPPAMLVDTRKVSDDDKPLVSAWTAKLAHCFALGRAFRAQMLTPESQAILNSQQSELEGLLTKLYAGELSYGDFNRGRQETYDKHAQQASGAAQKMFDERAAQAQAAQQATLDSQQRGFGDSTTDDSGLPGGGLGLSRGAYPVPRLPGLK